MEVMCGDFMWFLLPGQQLSLFPFKAAALFEAWFSGTLEAVTISKRKESRETLRKHQKNKKKYKLKKERHYFNGPSIFLLFLHRENLDFFSLQMRL